MQLGLDRGLQSIQVVQRLIDVGGAGAILGLGQPQDLQMQRREAERELFDPVAPRQECVVRQLQFAPEEGEAVLVSPFPDRQHRKLTYRTAEPLKAQAVAAAEMGIDDFADAADQRIVVGYEARQKIVADVGGGWQPHRAAIEYVPPATLG